MDIFGRKRIKTLEREIQKLKDKMTKEHEEVYQSINQVRTSMWNTTDALQFRQDFPDGYFCGLTSKPLWYRDKGYVTRTAIQIDYVYNKKVWKNTIYCEAKDVKKIISQTKGDNDTLKLVVECDDGNYWDVVVDMVNYTHIIYMSQTTQE